MKDEYIVGWLETQIKIMDKDIINLEKWVLEAKENLRKANQELLRFGDRLEGAKALRSYMDDLLVEVGPA